MQDQQAAPVEKTANKNAAKGENIEKEEDAREKHSL